VTGDEIRRQRFRVMLLGYDMSGVDGVLDHLAATLDAGGTPLADDCRSEFPKRLRGYDRHEVDEFLERVHRETR
jgi:DivIVA domain-containing protein